MGIFGAFFLYYMVERAFDSSLHFMTPWHFMNGLVHGEVAKREKSYNLESEEKYEKD